MAFPTLIAGSVPQILAGDKELKPVLQCIGAKHMQQAGAPSTSAERYRLALSDGTHWCSAMLATQLNELVRTGELGNGSYIKLQDYLCNRVQHRQVIIVLGLDILTVGPKVGDPQPYEPPSGALENVPPAPFQPPKQAAPAGYQGPAQAQTYGGGAPPSNSYYGAPMQQGGAPVQQGGFGGPQALPGGQGRYPTGGGYGGNGGGGYGGNAMVAGGGGYGGNAMVAGGYGQAPAYRANNTPIARNEAAPKVVPIASLNAYQNRWTIRARVTQRSDIRRYSNARGEGKFFTVDLLDAHGGEIRAIAFNEVADKFEDVLKMGAIVMISKASLKPKKPGSTYNQTRHDHEITLEKQTMIEVCPDEDAGPVIPQMQYHFRKIEEVESTVATTMLDVIGIVESVDAWQTITRKDGQETIKRAVVIKDDSSRSVEITLWGDYATNPGEQLEQMAKQGEKPILAVKSARVGDFNGKTLSTVGSSLIMVNPDIPEAGRLRHWYDQAGGAETVATKLSDQRGSGGGRVDRRCTVSAIKDEGLGQNGQAAFVQINAVVTMIKQENMFYPACSLNYNGRPCNKKLSDQGGTWWCERCQQNTDPEWRYILSITADDHTSSSWFTAFQEAGQQIMGASATELKELEQADLPAFEARVHATHFKPILLKVKIAEDTYNDETRIKTSIMRAEPLDYAKESRILLDYISKIKRGEAVMAPLPAPGGGHATGGYGMGNPGAPQYGAAGSAYGFKQQTPPKYGGEPAGYGGGGQGGYGAGNQGRGYSNGFGPGGF